MTLNDLEPYLQARIRVEPATGCWVWKGPLATGGAPYAILGRNNRPSVRKLLYERHIGDLLPSRMVTRNACDDPMCVHPEHTVKSTRAAVCKVLANEYRGPVHIAKVAAGRRRQSRLNWDVVRSIRARYATGGINQRALALEYAEYGLTYENVHKIVNNQTWREMPTSGLALVAFHAGML